MGMVGTEMVRIANWVLVVPDMLTSIGGSVFLVVLVLLPLLLVVESLLLLFRHVLSDLNLLLRFDLVAGIGQDVWLHGCWDLILRFLLLTRINFLVKDLYSGGRCDQLLLSVGDSIVLFGIHCSRLLESDSAVLERNMNNIQLKQCESSKRRSWNR